MARIRPSQQLLKMYLLYIQTAYNNRAIEIEAIFTTQNALILAISLELTQSSYFTSALDFFKIIYIWVAVI
jgi:hypothetical protein